MLFHFYKKIKEERGIEDFEYLSAWLIHHLIELYNKNSFIELNKREFTGYGICKPSFFYDVDFYYTIHPMLLMDMI